MKIFKLLVLFLFSQALYSQSLYLNDKSFVDENVFAEKNFSETSKNISSSAAFFSSFLLPGLGEYFSGNYSVGKYFTALDIALWGVLWQYSYNGRLYRDNYKAFARTKAGINFVGKDERFYANIGLYDDVFFYNNQKATIGDYASMYDEKKDYWKWESQWDRKKYRSLWKKSESCFNDIRFIVGGLFINRLASAIYAAATAKSIQTNNEGGDKTRTDLIIFPGIFYANFSCKF
jgi:hypothetical protein